jgi:hypothetical protein
LQGVTFYGLGGNVRVLAPSATPGIPSSIIEYKSVLFDLPILEYCPYRSFASKQEHGSAVPVLHRVGRAVFGERCLAGGRSSVQSQYRLFDRTADEFRLALLPVTARHVFKLCLQEG